MDWRWLRGRSWEAGVALTVLLCSVPILAHAGPIEVSPLRLTLGRERATAEVTLRNPSDGVSTIHVRAFAWRQDDRGQDVEEPTQDLVFYPKIARVPAGGKMLVRLAYTGPDVGPLERSYRLHLREIPTRPTEIGKVSVLLGLSMPVFVVPASGEGKGTLAGISLSGSLVQARVENPGARHVRIGRIEARVLDGAGRVVVSAQTSGWYVLAGGRRTFRATLPSQACAEGRRLAVDVDIDGVRQSQELLLDPSSCDAS